VSLASCARGKDSHWRLPQRFAALARGGGSSISAYLLRHASPDLRTQPSFESKCLLEPAVRPAGTAHQIVQSGFAESHSDGTNPAVFTMFRRVYSASSLAVLMSKSSCRYLNASCPCV